MKRGGKATKIQLSRLGLGVTPKLASSLGSRLPPHSQGTKLGVQPGHAGKVPPQVPAWLGRPPGVDCTPVSMEIQYHPVLIFPALHTQPPSSGTMGIWGHSPRQRQAPLLQGVCWGGPCSFSFISHDTSQCQGWQASSTA